MARSNSVVFKRPGLVRDRRQKKGLKQNSIAKVSASTVKRAEAGKPISRGHANTLADYLGISRTQLIAPLPPDSYLSFQQLLQFRGVTCSLKADVLRLLGEPRVVIGDVVLLDEVDHYEGVTPDRVRVNTLPSDSYPLPNYVHEAKLSADQEARCANNPLAALVDWGGPVLDQKGGGRLSLDVVRSDYYTNLRIKATAARLHNAMRKRNMIVRQSIPFPFGFAIVVVTQDNCVVLQKRAKRNDDHVGEWESISEYTRYDKDCDPTTGELSADLAIRRALFEKDELGVTGHVGRRTQITCVGVTLEWGLLDTALIAVATLPMSASEVDDMPSSAEHSHRSKVPFTPEACLPLILRGTYKKPKVPTSEGPICDLHRVALLAALCHRFGLQQIKEQIALLPEVDPSTLLTSRHKPTVAAHRLPLDKGLAEKTYWRYRNDPFPNPSGLFKHLQERHDCELLTLAGTTFPATVLWKNVGRDIEPDALLGELDHAEPVPCKDSAILSAMEYSRARDFIKAENTKGKIMHEGNEYCMTRINLGRKVPVIDGRFGLYYDNILTQYAMEFELRKAVGELGKGPLNRLNQPGALPLRESVENSRNPLLDGTGRCTAITVSTLVVYKRRTEGFRCLIRQRSENVAVSRGMLHVIPAGMFEAPNLGDRWSVTMNIWRELLEELYGKDELLGSAAAQEPDPILRIEPIPTLLSLIERGSAQLSVTGVVCDLLNLRPEICTVLFVDDPSFAQVKGMDTNWEYARPTNRGNFSVRWELMDDVLRQDVPRHGMVPSGAACIALGQEWVHKMHRI